MIQSNKQEEEEKGKLFYIISEIFLFCIVDELEEKYYDYRHAANLLYQGKISWFRIEANGKISMEDRGTKPSPLNATILSGSFNPLHSGHVNMMQEATKISAKDGIYNSFSSFELSIGNAAKPTINIDTVLRRAAAFAGAYSSK